MKLQKVKTNPQNDSLYNITLRDYDGSREYLNDLNKFLLIDKEKENNENKKKDKRNWSFCKTKYIDEANQFSKTLNYLPKNKINFVPSNLLSYGNPSTNMAYKRINNSNKKSENSIKIFNENNKELNNSNNFLESNSIYYNHGYNKKNIDSEYMNFKTNFILKFSKNVNNYDKLGSITDTISENNKKLVSDGIKKLKRYAEKKDRVLFDNMEVSDKNLYNWKENIILFFETETIWQKISDIILKELKNTRELMLILAKKNKELTDENKIFSDKIYKLNEFIRVNDFHNKSETMKKKMRNFYEKKQEFERKENMDFMNIHRLEEQ